MSNIFKIGCDPEFFLKNQAGESISAYGQVPGTKEEPYQLDGGTVQADGMAVEIGIDPVEVDVDNPASVKAAAIEFKNRINNVMQQVRGIVSSDLSFDISPIARFKPAHVAEMPDFVMELGCSADFCAEDTRYGRLQRNTTPYMPSTLRVAGGHIHVGWCDGADEQSEEHVQDCKGLVRFMDGFVLGKALANMTTKELEAENARSRHYGQPACFRPKSYGLEYRSPSNFWLQSDKHIVDVFVSVVTSIKAAILCHEKLARQDHCGPENKFYWSLWDGIRYRTTKASYKSFTDSVQNAYGNVL